MYCTYLIQLNNKVILALFLSISPKNVLVSQLSRYNFHQLSPIKLKTQISGVREINFLYLLSHQPFNNQGVGRLSDKVSSSTYSRVKKIICNKRKRFKFFLLNFFLNFFEGIIQIIIEVKVMRKFKTLHAYAK